MASIAALIGAQVVGSIGQGIAGGLLEQRRQNEFDKNFDLRKNMFDFQSNFMNRQLEQQFGLQSRGQNLNFLGGLTTSGMQVGSSLIGNLLNYNHAQDQLNFQKDLNSQRRTDLTNEGIPLSYLHLSNGGANLLSRSMGGNIPMNVSAGLGRSEGNPWGFANSGPNLGETFGREAPPPYSAQPVTQTPTERQAPYGMETVFRPL